MSVTAAELQSALVEAYFGDDDSEPTPDRDLNEMWDELNGLFSGHYVRVEDANEERGYRYEPGPAPVFYFGTAAVVEDFGGEGQGDTRYIVVSVTDNGKTQYFRVDGYYSSYNGTDWDDAELQEVQKVQRLVDFYEKVK